MLKAVPQHIASSPEIFNGKPHIVEHRIRVMDIVVWQKNGASPPMKFWGCIQL